MKVSFILIILNSYPPRTHAIVLDKSFYQIVINSFIQVNIAGKRYLTVGIQTQDWVFCINPPTTSFFTFHKFIWIFEDALQFLLILMHIIHVQYGRWINRPFVERILKKLKSNKTVWYDWFRYV